MACDGDELVRAGEPGADGFGITAGACEGRQLRLRAQPHGAEPDAELCQVAGLRPGQAVGHGSVGVCPAALPQRELADVPLVDGHLGVHVHGRRRGLDVRSGGVEVTAAGLEAGAHDEGLVGQFGRHGAERGRADAVGLVPLADRDQGLDLVGNERGQIEPVAVQRLAARSPPVAPPRGAGPASSARR